MLLSEKQHIHSMRIAKLILYADSLGYRVTGGDWYRDSRCSYGHKDSLHRLRLATDLNLHRYGKWLTATEDHAVLGAYWETMGGAWGGNFLDEDGNPDPDGNHYSTPHNGFK